MHDDETDLVRDACSQHLFDGDAHRDITLRMHQSHNVALFCVIRGLKIQRFPWYHRYALWMRLMSVPWEPRRLQYSIVDCCDYALLWNTVLYGTDCNYRTWLARLQVKTQRVVGPISRPGRMSQHTGRCNADSLPGVCCIMSTADFARAKRSAQVSCNCNTKLRVDFIWVGDWSNRHTSLVLDDQYIS